MNKAFRFTKAIVRTPGESLVAGLTNANLGAPDYATALIQHSSYIDALRAGGLEVMVLEADEKYPDSVFVEDIALLTTRCAIITRPGVVSRQGETDPIGPVLAEYFNVIESIQAPGTVEAGDIMMVGKHYFIGLSERTNTAGAEQMITLLNRHGLSGTMISCQEMLHLKTGVAYLEHNNLLVYGEFIEHPAFRDFNKIIVDADEDYAANCIWINDTVLLPAGYPKTQQKITAAGYSIIEVDVSEFRKLDGGLSCLSLRF